MLEAPVGLSSTGKVEGAQDWRPEGSCPSSHWPVPGHPEPSIRHSLLELEVGRSVAHHITKQGLKESGGDWGHTESQSGASF